MVKTKECQFNVLIQNVQILQFTPFSSNKCFSDSVMLYFVRPHFQPCLVAVHFVGMVNGVFICHQISKVVDRLLKNIELCQAFKGLVLCHDWCVCVCVTVGAYAFLRL